MEHDDFEEETLIVRESSPLEETKDWTRSEVQSSDAGRFAHRAHRILEHHSQLGTEGDLPDEALDLLRLIETASNTLVESFNALARTVGLPVNRTLKSISTQEGVTALVASVDSYAVPKGVFDDSNLKLEITDVTPTVHPPLDLPPTETRVYLQGKDSTPFEVKTLTCGCCSNGCVCWNHQDVPQGRPVNECNFHKNAKLRAMSMGVSPQGVCSVCGERHPPLAPQAKPGEPEILVDFGTIPLHQRDPQDVYRQPTPTELMDYLDDEKKDGKK